MKPSFIIIGGIKCASSSLYRYLNNHPQVLPCKTKEPGYFNSKSIFRLMLGYRRYINLFPKQNQSEAVGDWLDLGADEQMHASQFKKVIKPDINYITGEATASTFVFANPKMVKLLFPKIKLILLLRDPSERFISHYNMLHRFHKEGRKGYDLGELDAFIDQEVAAYKAGAKTRILAQGIYMDKLSKWKKSFGNQLKIYETSTLNNEHASQTMADICTHLDIAQHDFTEVLKTKYNSTGKGIERSKAYEKLHAFYAADSEALFKEYAIRFGH